MNEWKGSERYLRSRLKVQIRVPCMSYADAGDGALLSTSGFANSIRFPVPFYFHFPASLYSAPYFPFRKQ